MGEKVTARKRRGTKRTRSQSVIYISMEGSVTEPRYFDRLIREYKLKNVRLLKRSKTKSSPNQVIARLDDYKSRRKKEHDVELVEEFWAVIDRDNWPPETLARAAKRAERKGYKIADSNPCFELWLLLHLTSLDKCKGLAGSAEIGGAKKVLQTLKEIDPGFDKTTYRAAEYVDKVETAIKNALKTDTERDTRWLNQIGSRVYKLALSIINSSPNNPSH